MIPDRTRTFALGYGDVETDRANLAVSFNGPAEALDAVLMNVRPHGVTYTSIITTQGACQGGITVTCEFGAVPRCPFSLDRPHEPVYSRKISQMNPQMLKHGLKLE